MQLGLQVERKQLRALRFDDSLVLQADFVLETAEVVIAGVVGVIQGEYDPCKALFFIDRGSPYRAWRNTSLAAAYESRR